MLRYLLTALPVIVSCMVLQAAFAAKSMKYYARFTETRQAPALGGYPALLSWVLVLTLAVKLPTRALGAGLFMLLDQFDDFATAFYHSCVNFVTLGYGDIVMNARWRLLGPLEGANGILMFGVSTAVMTAAVMDVIKFNMQRLQAAGSKSEQDVGKQFR